MIRNLVIQINSQHSRPTEVAWMVRETSWSVTSRRESVVATGYFDTPVGGAMAVLQAALLDIMESIGVQDLCPCGKPAAHVLAHEDTAMWACRVPTA